VARIDPTRPRLRLTASPSFRLRDYTTTGLDQQTLRRFRGPQLRLFMLVDLVDTRTDGLKLSLKLYHANRLPLVHQQLTTEAPVIWTDSSHRLMLIRCRLPLRI
jgi:hypothetical protein